MHINKLFSQQVKSFLIVTYLANGLSATQLVFKSMKIIVVVKSNI